MCATETRFVDGTTTEGLPFNLQLRFEVGAPEGAMPVEVACSYQANDGPGTVVIAKRADGLYAYTDDESVEKWGDLADVNPNNLMPCLVVEGTWGGQQS